MKPNFLFLFVLYPFICLSQIDSTSFAPGTDDLIESFLQEQENGVDFEYNDLFEELAGFRKNPLNLNEISKEDLKDFPFLSPLQIEAFDNYQSELGPLISIYELQAIPHFDLKTIQALIPYINSNVSNPSSLSDIWSGEFENQLILRTGMTLQEKRGFLLDESGKSNYEGSRQNLYLRYRGSIANKLSFGFTAEKDEGESLFSKSNKQGFDFYSAHLFYQNHYDKIRAVALGDYAVSMGQGLILFNGFATRKGPTTLNIKRTGRSLRRYSSVNESDFFRGAAISFAPFKNIELTAFYSNKRRDANLEETSEFEDEDESVFVTSLQSSGKHRTAAEINDENAIRQTSYGGILKWESGKTAVSINVLYNTLDKPLSRNDILYNQFYFAGDQLMNMSLDYSHTWRNIHFFGETATDDNGSMATVNGLMTSLDPRFDISLFYRKYEKDYKSLNAKPFAETSGGRNEEGIYLGFEFRPTYRWTLNAYFDQWEHEWLRFRTDAPSNGNEWLIRLTYKERKKMEIHFQFKSERKYENEDASDGRYDEILERTNVQGRIHFAYKLSKSLEWRTRIYAGYTEKGAEKLEGVAMFQDLKYRALGVPISFSTRFVLFDTDAYDIRFYAYENDVLYSFTVPAYYGRGSRFYVNANYKIKRGMTLEGRIARTYFTDRNEIGSGNEAIDVPAKTDVKLQLRWNF